MLKSDLNTPNETPVKTSTPIRNMTGHVEAPCSVSINTAVVESFIENELNSEQVVVTNNSPTKADSVSKKQIEALSYTVKLSSLNQRQTETRLENKDDLDNFNFNLKVLNAFLKVNFSIQIDYESTTNFFYINEKLSMNALTTSCIKDYIKIDIFDQVIEIDSIPVDEFISNINAIGFDMQEVNMKLIDNQDFKLCKLKVKWRNILEETNYQLEEMVNIFFCYSG